MLHAICVQLTWYMLAILCCSARLTHDSVSALQVTCHAASAGAMSTVLELCTQGSTTQQLAVTAAAMEPSIALNATRLDLGVCYVGVPTSVDVTMSNLTLLPTAFEWEGYGLEAQQAGRGQMTVTVHPGQGTLPPGAEYHLP